MPASLRRLFSPNKLDKFEQQELDGTNLSATKLEMVLSRRWSNKYTVEVMPTSPCYHIFSLLSQMRSNRLTVYTPGGLSQRDIDSCYRWG